MLRLLGHTQQELRDIAVSLGMPAFTGSQMAKWIYQKHATSVNQMTDISVSNRKKLLDAGYEVGLMPHANQQRSKDGTVKYLFPVSEGELPLTVETVFIPDHDRATLCVSCQVGCKMNCLFCQTGKQGWQGNLTTSDILNQIYALPEVSQLTNIVFMGQGEPMDNIDAVLKATEILQASYALAWSPKRITVSTVGIKDKLKRFLDESSCHIAVSMHTPIHEQRMQLVPAEKAMPISQVVELLKQYPAFTRHAAKPEDTTTQRRLTFEYTMFKGVNDTITHAKEILRLLRGLECRINIIRYHKIPGIDLLPCDSKTMETFRDYLLSHGITTTIRASRGEDIYAACGLLNTAKHC
ncbi:MAG: 23S rRNA (adenine(2503)-C(2))-methyltransferase RlmN [Bacteroidaceae bacterium]|nr:23S rRNA (adenine(2503)-C(2))-methyltransferase RlmN [Bacteroidaceae bacterium]